MGVAHRVQRAADRDQEGIRAFELGKRIIDLALHRFAPRASDQVNDDFRIDGGLEEGTFLDQTRA